MSLLFAEPADPDSPADLTITQDQLDKAREYAARLASVGGSLLSNASLLKKLLDQIDTTTT